MINFPVQLFFLLTTYNLSYILFIGYKELSGQKIRDFSIESSIEEVDTVVRDCEGTYNHVQT